MTRTRASLVLLGVFVLGVVSGVFATGAFVPGLAPERDGSDPSATPGRPGPHRGQW